jgi:hypothetical protein
MGEEIIISDKGGGQVTFVGFFTRDNRFGSYNLSSPLLSLSFCGLLEEVEEELR